MFKIKYFLKTLVNFIFPPECYLCSNKIQDYGLCPDCFISLEVYNIDSCKVCGVDIFYSDICAICEYKGRNFSSVSYCFRYNDEIFRLLNSFKSHDKTYLAKFLANFLIARGIKSSLQENIDIIIPVPIHYSKLIKRKYNHICLLGYYVAKAFNLKFSPFILQKVKKTKDQISLEGRKRLNNVRGAFHVKKSNVEYVTGKRVLLLEDVVTTGSTINECTKALLKAGASEVHVLCLARVEGILKI